jgi:hypothetical protein
VTEAKAYHEQVVARLQALLGAELVGVYAGGSTWTLDQERGPRRIVTVRPSSSVVDFDSTQWKASSSYARLPRDDSSPGLSGGASSWLGAQSARCNVG